MNVQQIHDVIVMLLMLVMFITSLPFEEVSFFRIPRRQSIPCQGALLLSHQALGDCQAV